MNDLPEFGVSIPPTPAPVRYLTITEVTTDKPASIIAPDMHEVTCPVGATVTIKGQFNLPLTDKFRMPMRKRGLGNEGLLIANVIDGALTVVAPFKNPTDDGVWVVTEEMINASLPSDQRIGFAGFSICVYR